LGRGEGLELAGGFELGVLLGGWVLGRAHGFPDGEGVGVGVVDAKVFDEDPVDGGGDAGDFDGDLGVRCGQVGVVGREDGGRRIVDRADDSLRRDAVFFVVGDLLFAATVGFVDGGAWSRSSLRCRG
jgi:hypothetical protein